MPKPPLEKRRKDAAREFRRAFDLPPNCLLIPALPELVGRMSLGIVEVKADGIYPDTLAEMIVHVDAPVSRQQEFRDPAVTEVK